jgi:hypothetical protein
MSGGAGVTSTPKSGSDTEKSNGKEESKEETEKKEEVTIPPQ